MNQLDTEGAVTVVESPKLRNTVTSEVKRGKIFQETTQHIEGRNKTKQTKQANIKKHPEDFFSKSNIKDRLNKMSILIEDECYNLGQH